MKIQHITIQTGSFEEELSFYETYAGMPITKSHHFGKIFTLESMYLFFRK